MPRRKKGTHSGKSGSGGGMSINKGKPQQRNAANARERARMRVLSRAFCRLKTTLPWVPADTKLSKLDTLRLAASYIAHLKKELTDDNILSSDENPSHAEIALTWPFGFNRPALLRGGGNGSSEEGGGSDAEEESSSGCWESVESPNKDCIHLDNSNQPNLLGKHIHEIQLQHDSTNYKCHPVIIDSNSEDPSCNNNNNLPYNFHHVHQHRQQQHTHSSMSYFQNDVIMSLS